MQLATAEVVLAALDDRHRHVTPERGSRERNVVAEQLLLERLGRRGDDDAETRFERRQEIGETLADTGAGLGDEVTAGRERRGDLGRERGLLGALLELGQRARKRRRRGRSGRPSPPAYATERMF